MESSRRSSRCRTGRDPLPRAGRQLRRPGHRHPTAPRPDHHRRDRVRPARRHRSPAAVPAGLHRLRTPLPRRRLALALRPMGPLPTRAHHRGQPARPTLAPLPRRDHKRRVLPHARSQDERRTTPLNQLNYPRGGDIQPATSGGRNLAVDSDWQWLAGATPGEAADQSVKLPRCRCGGNSRPARGCP